MAKVDHLPLTTHDTWHTQQTTSNPPIPTKNCQQCATQHSHNESKILTRGPMPMVQCQVPRIPHSNTLHFHYERQLECSHCAISRLPQFAMLLQLVLVSRETGAIEVLVCKCWCFDILLVLKLFNSLLGDRYTPAFSFNNDSLLVTNVFARSSSLAKISDLRVGWPFGLKLIPLCSSNFSAKIRSAIIFP